MTSAFGSRLRGKLSGSVRVHDCGRTVFLRHRASVVVDLRLRPGAGLELRAVVAVAGDAGVGTGFSGTAHDVCKVAFGGWLV